MPNVTKSVAFIGSVGVPNIYGGFEAFLESVAPEIVKAGYHVTVTCDKTKYMEKLPTFKGIELTYVGINANGWTSPIHDLVAFLKTFWRHDAVVVLGVSAGPFFLLMRLLASFFRRRLVVNVDGVEWRRTKFSKKVQLVLKVFDWCAQFSAHRIVYDNEGLYDFVYPAMKKKAVCIPYSGDHVVRFHELESEGYALTICRIEPENNLEMLIEAAIQSSVHEYRIVGNWNNSQYGRELKEKYRNHPKVKLLDPVYDSQKVGKLREQCSMYLHGHSVGGTNPSLVEMLYYDCALFCYDCTFNRSTAQEFAQYFGDSEQLASLISAQVHKPERTSKAIKESYTAASISGSYIKTL